MAWERLGSTPGRTAALAAPIAAGVAIVVATMATVESARLDLRDSLLALGADQVVVTSSAAADGGVARLPGAAKERALRLSGAEVATALVEHPDTAVVASTAADPLGAATLTTTVYSADADLLATLRTSLRWGRFLDRGDDASAARVAVLGSEAAQRFGIPAEAAPTDRSVIIDGRAFLVVGVVASSASLPAIDRSVLVPSATARHDIDPDPRPTHLVVRCDPDTTAAMEDALPQAIGYGAGSPPNASSPQDLRRAGDAFESSLALVVVGSGGLATVLGAVAIALVIGASVVTRTSEIGIRQAIGATRGDIGLLFLIEAAIVGAAGACAGAFLGPVAGAAIALGRGAPVVVDWPLSIVVGVVAAELALLCGTVPAVRASRLQPMAALAR